VTHSIASVTVAYNGAMVLQQHIEALLGQMRPLQEIVIVDNGSSDGTCALIAERYPQITLLKLPENLGVGGGLAAGMAYAALEKRHDWVLTFDQDSVPHEDALKTLLKGMESLNGEGGEVGIAAAMPVHTETGACYPPLIWRDGFVKPSPDLLRQPIWFADLVITSGCMVRRDVVEKVGLPRTDFFIDFVDFEYCLRVRSSGYKIAVIPSAELGHEIGNAREVWFFGRQRLWPGYAPWREYYYSRNLAYAGWHLYPNRGTKRFVLGHLARHAGAVVLFSPKKVACLRKMAQGFSDGWRARLGMRFSPNGQPNGGKNGATRKSSQVLTGD